MAEHQEDIDWRALEESPAFRELVAKRRAFVVPATIFYLAWYMGFILLVAYAEDFMSERVYEGLTVGYCLALTQFVMVVVLGLMYLNKSEKVFDPLAAKAIEQYEGHHQRYAAADDYGNGEPVGSRAATTSTTEAGR
jgi:uncharacterized membrane protein (DUF485 family)